MPENKGLFFVKDKRIKMAENKNIGLFLNILEWSTTWWKLHE